MNDKSTKSHSAEDAALGFYFQTFYALYAILDQPHDDATVCVERLDDVEVRANSETLLTQLKHSMSDSPTRVTLASKMLWRTLKAWIDVLPKLVLTESYFQLVTVAELGSDEVLGVLLDRNTDRSKLHDALVQEAQRVVKEYNEVKSSGGQPPFPHADRISSCQAYLSLPETDRKSLLSRVQIYAGQSNIGEMVNSIASKLVNFPPERRLQIAERILEWWDLQIIFTLCGKREKFISKLEVQREISEIAGEIEREELLPDFEHVLPPSSHQPDSMLVKQIELVSGKPSDIQIATREEWRAREQRHKWIKNRLDMAVRVDRYDDLLKESWLDKHVRMIEECEGVADSLKCKMGLKLLRWTHDEAHKEIRPFANNWNAPYYIRGSYQILAINVQVGWHPNYKKLLGID